MAVFLYYYDVYPIMQQYYRICLIIFYCSHSPLSLQFSIENFLKYSQDIESSSLGPISHETLINWGIEFSGCLCTASVTAELASAA